MRAKMSEPIAYRLSAEVYGDAPRGVLAERELLGILAETEPSIDGETGEQPVALLHFVGPRAGWGAGYALAASLAGFINQEMS